jgi:OOP family OmpA-OmpF porin
MRARDGWASALACAALLLGGPARGQGIGDVALDQLDPAPAGDPFTSVASPFIGGHLSPRARVLVNHASRPLVLSTDSASGEVVSDQTLLLVDASFALWDRLLVSALLPVVVAQSGESPLVQGAPLPSPSSAAVSDLRLGLRVRLFGEEEEVFQAAASAYFHVPTGSPGAFAGDGSLRLAPQLLLGGRHPRFVWSASLGAMIRASRTPSGLTFGAGAGVLLWDQRIQIGPELFGATPLRGGIIEVEGARPIVLEGTPNLELLLGARFRLPAGFSVSAAGGPGLTDAIGTPSFRIVVGVSWALPAKPAGAGGAAGAGEEGASLPGDTDADGLPDASDPCPYAFGAKAADPKRSGCPIDDRDEDGALDPDDACPDTPGDPSPDVKKNGCPSDAAGNSP